MAVDWSILALPPLSGKRSEITTHSLTHGERGFKFYDTEPGERYYDHWRKIFMLGRENKLRNHWTPLGDDEIKRSYIFAPFRGAFIFIWPARGGSRSGNETEMHSKICEDSVLLALERIPEFGGLLKPPSNSIGLGTKENDITEVKSQSESGLGLSSWLFQSSERRAETGVCCGMKDEILREYFPKVRLWIKETVASAPVRETSPEKFDPLQSLVISSETPEKALGDFHMLERVSVRFDIDLDILTRVLLKDNGLSATIQPSSEMKARVELGDRDGSLNLLKGDANLAEIWLRHPKNIHQGDQFPFTPEEVEKLEGLLGGGCYDILRACMLHMSEYPSESRVKMARILTKHGKQNQIEEIWGEVGPIGRSGLEPLIEDIYQWRENRQISDFWGLLSKIEVGPNILGRHSPPDEDFRRRMCLQILTRSWKGSDLPGIIGYIPHLAASAKANHYETDWNILVLSGKNPDDIISQINRLEDGQDIIRQRLELFIERKLVPRNNWELGKFIPEKSQHLLDDHQWIAPLLEKIESRRIYKLEQPSDGLKWVAKLSEAEFLSCLKRPVMRELIAKPETLTEHPPEDWRAPKAVSAKLPDDAADWERRKEWARLIVKPSWLERLAHRKDMAIGILWCASVLAVALSAAAPIVLLRTVEGAHHIGFILAGLSLIAAFYVEQIRSGEFKKIGAGNKLDKFMDIAPILISVSLALIGISEMQKINLSFITSVGLTMGDFSGVEVPILDNPLVMGAMTVIFYQVMRVMRKSHSTAREEKRACRSSIGIN